MIQPPQHLGPERPLRVHVVGSSVSVIVEPEHGPRDGGAYGEHLVTVLAARGVPATVTQSSAWYSLVSEHLPRYERDVRNHFPDVLVTSFGLIESQPAVLPLALVRHVLTWDRTSRPGARAYRERVVPPVWRRLRAYQQWAAARVDGRTHRLAPGRFVTDLSRLVDLVRKDCGSLVLLLDIDPPGDRVEHWLPTAQARVARYNDLLAQVAASYDDDVRLVRAGAALVDPVRELPDGLHRTSDSHRATACLLADQICAWLGR